MARNSHSCNCILNLNNSDLLTNTSDCTRVLLANTLEPSDTNIHNIHFIHHRHRCTSSTATFLLLNAVSSLFLLLSAVSNLFLLLSGGFSFFLILTGAFSSFLVLSGFVSFLLCFTNSGGRTFFVSCGRSSSFCLIILGGSVVYCGRRRGSTVLLSFFVRRGISSLTSTVSTPVSS